MKMFAVMMGVLVAAVCVTGCATKKSPAQIDKSARELLAEHKDVVLSGKTGAIKGSAEDIRLAAVASPTGDYPKESIRYFLIEDFAKDLDPECLAMLKSRQDVVIDGKTGELQGCEKGKNPGSLICPKCGFPKGSLRQLILVGKDYMWKD